MTPVLAFDSFYFTTFLNNPLSHYLAEELFDSYLFKKWLTIFSSAIFMSMSNLDLSIISD